MAEPHCTSIAELRDRLGAAVSRSPADRTAISCVEVRRQSVVEGGRGRGSAPALERTLTVRVVERGRVGHCRTGTLEPAELDTAVRIALATARLAEPGGDDGATAPPPVEDGQSSLFDPNLAHLEAEAARALVADALSRRERGELEWAEGRFVSASENGLAFGAALTAASFSVSCGRRPGSGGAASAARTLAELSLAATVERARSRHGGPGVTEPPGDSVPAVLSEEAAAALVDQLGSLLDAAESSPALLGATARLPLSLVDDPRGPGLGTPWDLAGRPRRLRQLVADGRIVAPLPAAALGARSLVLAAGEADVAALRLAAAGGLWIGELDPAVGYDGHRVRLVARGVRRIDASGALVDAVADAVWEDDLGRLFAALAGVGNSLVARATGDRFWRSAAAPALRLDALPPLRALPG